MPRTHGGALVERARPTDALIFFYSEVFDDLRQFIDAAKKVSEWQEIKGTDWNLEIGALIEASENCVKRW